MLHSFHNPNYTDNKKENHFKVYSSNHVEWSQVDDNDVFLYYSQQASGYSGSKGIACIVLSLVTGQGSPFQHLNNDPPNPHSYRDGLCESDLEDLTLTSVYTIKKTPIPGPVALVRFQIWSVGKDKENIETDLQNAVRHALWDLLMEYRALTAPICEYAHQDDSVCYSEPTTPIRVRRSGRTAIDQNFPEKESQTAGDLQNSKEMSSSVPDIPTKGNSPQSMLKELSMFKFNNGPQSARPEFYSEMSNPSSQPDVMSPECEKTNLNYMFHSVMKPFLQFGDDLSCPCLSKEVFVLPSRHSVVTILKEIQNIIKTVTREVHPKVFLRFQNALNADTEFIPFNPQENLSSAANAEYTPMKPGSTRCFIIVGRNNRQWRTYMGNSDFLKFQETSIDSLKIYQKNQTHICYPPNTETVMDSLPSSPTSISRSNSIATLISPRMKLSHMQAADSLSLQGSPPAFVPRQTLLLMYIEDKKLTVFLYNWSQDTTAKLLKQLTKLIQWHHQRSCFLNNIILQKCGLFHAQICPQRAAADKNIIEEKAMSSKQSTDNAATTTQPIIPRVPFTSSYMDQLIHNHSPTREGQTASTSSRSSTSNLKSVYILDILKNNQPSRPFHLSSSATIKDPVTAHGVQFQDTVCKQKRDMQELYNMWQTRGASLSHPFIERMPKLLKRVARMSHYCLTPILFNPSWRWKVAPIRDHTLQPLEQTFSFPDRSSESSRSRHSSGSSMKNIDAGNNSSTPRSRRVSGTNYNDHGSPKLRTKNPSEETWHNTVCRHYLQEYVQYLHTIGFVSLQTSDGSQSRSVRRSFSEDEKSLRSSESLPQHRNSPPIYYLIKSLLGGLLVFEIGLSDPYAYAHLYSIECLRFNMQTYRTLSSQFTPALLDELDKIKLLNHLHSFTYDYHLRTIHSYISGRQLIFRHGYHLTSFLDDFIKYYQKTPNGARNLLYAGVLTIPENNMSGDQLYNYIISHNQLYAMTVLRMVPVILDSSSSIDTEFALVELSAQKASYKDVNDVCQMGNFDVGLLISHNTTLEDPLDKNMLILNYYIILTSQRDLYPKLLTFGLSNMGSFQTVRFGSMQTSAGSASRKTSMVSAISEKECLESSGEESTSSTEARSKKSSIIRSMCDEDVTYLGYYSNQETMMQEVLLSQAKAAQAHLSQVVEKAAVHCRRDFLWSSLLPRTLKEESSNRDHGTVANYLDFSELLNLVSRIPLDNIDATLTPFMNMHVSFYQSLANVLKSKYADNHREFLSPDGYSLCAVVTNVRCPDSFMLLSIDWRCNKTELCLVFREPPSYLQQEDDKPVQRVVALQSLVEEFMNLCSFHLWSGIV